MRQLLEQRQAGGGRGSGPELDLVIPAFNEEKRIRATLAALITEAEECDLSMRILVVDNGCIDATSDIVRSTYNERTSVELISCRTRGKGAAVGTGVRRSTAPYVGYCDADLSTPPSAVTLGMDLLHSGWEVVIGSRRCTGAGYSVPQGHLRRMGGFAFRVMTGGLNGPITDTQCGFKLFTSKVAKELFSPTTPTGFAFDVEVLAQALQRNHRMIELPISWSDQPESSFRPVVDGFRSFRELREIRRTIGGNHPVPQR